MKTCIVDEVEARITEALTEWDAGRAASPDQRDYVILADAVLRERDPSYVAPTFDPFPFETIADEMYGIGEDLPEVRALAIYATARLYGFERPERFDFDALETLAEQIQARAPEAERVSLVETLLRLPESTKTVLVHLNVEVPEADARSADEVAQAILGALEVGSDDESVRDLRVVVALTEEV